MYLAKILFKRDLQVDWQETLKSDHKNPDASLVILLNLINFDTALLTKLKNDEAI